jgi:Ras-related protein Rab-6A
MLINSKHIRYYRDCDIAVIVYDITNRNSFNETKKWIEFAREIRGDDLRIFLVGNKTDLAVNQLDEIYNRKITYLDGDKQAKSYGCKFLETSAKTAYNVTNLFRSIAAYSLTNINEMETLNLIDENQTTNVVEVQLNRTEFDSNSNNMKCCNLS